jgi:hypothetical protein
LSLLCSHMSSGRESIRVTIHITVRTESLQIKVHHRKHYIAIMIIIDYAEIKLALLMRQTCPAIHELVLWNKVFCTLGLRYGSDWHRDCTTEAN